MVTQTKLTYQDYANTPDDERYELIDGVLIMVPAPNVQHQDSQASLGSRMRVFVERHDLGKVLFAPTDVVLTDTDTVQPDVLFISNEREHIITEANIQGSARPRRRDSVPFHCEARLARKARPIRQTWREANTGSSTRPIESSSSCSSRTACSKSKRRTPAATF